MVTAASSGPAPVTLAVTPSARSSSPAGPPSGHGRRVLRRRSGPSTGFAHGPEWLVRVGGALASTGVLLALWNLSGALSARPRTTTILGLRLSVAFLVVTTAFGVMYAFGRQTGWFSLYSHRVLAHAHLGLLGWLGLTYVAVAKKLWPMFLLAHGPKARAGDRAVRLVGAGTILGW